MKHWTHLLMKTGLSLEKENMIWNMTGSFFYAFASMVLSFLVLRIAGEEQGGIFSFGFSTVGQQMFLLAYFGIRPFHITDGTNQYRFGDYLHHRYVTCALALLLGAGYLACIGYSWQKAQIIFLLIVYKVIDGFADVYESEFQRQGFDIEITAKDFVEENFNSLPSVRFCRWGYFWPRWFRGQDCLPPARQRFWDRSPV